MLSLIRRNDSMLKTMIGFEFDYHLEFASYRKKVVVNMVQNVQKRLCSKILG